ncbi:phosphotransferase family protein [Schaalia suimastitidis]|uniref:phosphotransferase family protein n=1 Tax=Schaalia suimastitidis TaxID=121163 RepID=UPI0004037366|nr:phosphotransferase [Schaalia suimastitidis]
MQTADIVDFTMDSTAISDAFGRPVETTRIRIKPEHSLALSLKEGATGATYWAQILWPHKRDKATTIRRETAGQIHECEMPGELLLIGGQALTDPALDTYTRTLALDGYQILRHNPLRRLVVGNDTTICRVSARPQVTMTQLHSALADLPIPALVSAPHIGPANATHVSAQQRLGSHDLSQVRSAHGHWHAGQILAALHGHAAAAMLRQPRGIDRHLAAGTAHIGILSHLAPALAQRLAELLPLVKREKGQCVLTHGDASPDQFLANDAETHVWITDFERARLAPREADLGSYLQCAPPHAAQPFLDGYEAGGGQVPDDDYLRDARARTIVEKLAEPLRNAQPTWKNDMNNALDELEGLLR